jgi:hypothetical protein
MLSMSSGVVRPLAGLHDHVVLLGIALVARDLAAAQHGLHGARDDVDAHAHVGRLLAVDHDAQLGLVQAQVDVDALDAGILGDLVQHLAHHAARFS